MEQAYAGYVYGDSTCGRRRSTAWVSPASPSTTAPPGPPALFLARQAVEGGMAQCVVGFEQMERGALNSKYTTIPTRWKNTWRSPTTRRASTRHPRRADTCGGAGREYRWKYGTKRETFAKVSAKARQHASKNPYALLDQILEKRYHVEEVFDP